MLVITIFLVLIILSILILYPMYTQLSEAPDLALRYLAKLDANLERRIEAITILVGIVRDEMKQDLTLIKEIESVRGKIKSIKKRWNNADERFNLHKTMEEQMRYIYKSMRNYPNIKSNINLRETLEEMGTVEKHIIIDSYNYNEHLKKFKKLVKYFPSNLIAQALNIECKFTPYPTLTKEQQEAQSKNYTPQSSVSSENNGQPQAHYFEDEGDPGSFFTKGN